jgi:hypothetical protein|tara:strand:- start:1033 stop:1275 length:243 start_codon:yes stop_codon:yes gene_type:complete
MSNVQNRKAFHTSPKDNNFEVVMVQENVSGYFTLDPKSPYYFSGSEQDAQSKANELNENLFKLDKKQVAEIVLSSMFGRR